MLQFFQSSVIVSSLIVTGCYYFVLITQDNLDKLFALFKGIIILILVSTSLITAIVILVFRVLNILDEYFLLITVGFPIVLIVNSLVLSFDYLFIRLDKYTNISISRIAKSGTTATGQLISGITNINNGLIVGFILGRVISLIFYIWRLGYKNISTILSTYSAKVREVLIESYKQPLYILPSTLVSSGATELVIFVIATLFGGFELGIYSLAYRIISIPSLLIGTSIGDVFFKESSSMIQQAKSILMFTIRTWYILFAIGFLPMLALWLFSTDIVVFIFGEAWEVTGTIAKILAPYILFSFMSSSTGKLFISLNAQNYSFYFSLLIFLARISGLYIGYLTGSFIFAISLMVAFHFVALLIYNVALFNHIFKYERESVLN